MCSVRRLRHSCVLTNADLLHGARSGMACNVACVIVVVAVSVAGYWIQGMWAHLVPFLG